MPRSEDSPIYRQRVEKTNNALLDKIYKVVKKIEIQNSYQNVSNKE